MKPLFSNKVKPHRIVNLVKKDNVNDDDKEIFLMNILLILSQKLGIVIEKSNFCLEEIVKESDKLSNKKASKKLSDTYFIFFTAQFLITRFHALTFLLP